MSRKKILLSGTIINTAASLFIALLNFLIVPVLIGHLGIIEFGLIGIVNLFAMIGYISLFDLGMTISVPKFIAEYKSKNEIRKINELINTSLILFIIIGIILVIVLIPLLKTIVTSFFNIPPSSIELFLKVVSLLIVTYSFQFPLLLLKSIMQGFMRFDILNIVLTIVELLKFATIYFLVVNGFGYEIVIYSNIIAAFILTISYYFLIFRVFPEYRFSSISFKAIKSIRKLSSLLFVGKVSSLLYNNTDRLLVSIFLSPAVMASYEVLSKLPMIINKFLGLAVSTIIPVTSSINKETEKNIIKNLYHRGFRLYFAFICPLILACIFFSKDFILLWVGNEFAHLHNLLILMLTWSLLTPLLFGGNILTGMDKGMKELTIVRISQAIIKVASGFSLIIFLDLAAIPISFLISSVSIIYAIRVFKKEIKFDLSLFFKDILTIILSSFVPLFIGYVLFMNYKPSFLIELGIYIMTWCSIQWVLIYFITFDKEDKKTIQQILRLNRKI